MGAPWLGSLNALRMRAVATCLIRQFSLPPVNAPGSAAYRSRRPTGDETRRGPAVHVAEDHSQPADPRVAKKFCPACGQKLAVERSRLFGTIQCPRCAEEHPRAMFFDLGETLDAVEPLAPAMLSAPRAELARWHVGPFAPPAAGAFAWQGHDTVVDALPAVAEGWRSEVSRLVHGSTSWAAVARGASRVARRLWNAALDVSAAIDEFLAGYRLASVFTAALVGVVVPLFGTDGAAVVVAAWGSVAFVGLGVVFALAAVSAFRAELGDAPATTLIGRRMLAAWEQATAAADEFGESSKSERMRQVGAVAVGLGVVAMEAGSLATQVLGFDDAAPGARTIALVCTGGALWLGGWYLDRASIAARWFTRAAIVPAAQPLDVRPIIVGGLAPVRAVPSSADPAGAVLEALTTWRPRAFDYECSYQDSLHRHLRRAVPWLRARTEMKLHVPGVVRARFDIVVEAPGGQAVAIELKRRLDSGSADRAHGQLDRYASAWQRGPFVLVMCDPERNHAPRVCAAVREMRRAGKEVFAVMVPAKGSKGGASADELVAMSQAA